MPENQHPRKGFRGHANHGELGAVQANVLAENRRVASEFVLPEVRPEHHHGIAPRHLIFVLPKSPPQPRLYAEHMEVVAGNKHATLDPRSGSWFAAEAHRFHCCVGDYAVVALRFAADVQVFAIGEIVEARVTCRAYQTYHAARMRYRVRPENQRIDHAESPRGHSDPQRERDHHERSKSGRAAQAPDRVVRVVEEIRQPINASHIPHLLFPLFQSVHRAHRRVARLFWGKPIGDAFLDFLLQVKLELFLQLVLDVAAAKEGAQAKRDGVQPMLWAHRISLGARCAQAPSSRTT